MVQISIAGEGDRLPCCPHNIRVGTSILTPRLTATRSSSRASSIAPGLEADLVIIDAPIGSAADVALQTLKIGDTPGISGVIIDGELVVRKSANTPPAIRQFKVNS